MTREAVIVAGLRTAVGRSKKGTTRNWRSDDMTAAVIAELMKRTGIDPTLIDDVVIGCAMPEGTQGLNFGRSIALRAGLPTSVPGMTVNRFCSSGLQTIAQSAERIIANGADIIIAGGAETMSLVPMTGFRISPNPWLADNHPEAYMGMGLTAEQVAKEFNVSREEQDAFAVKSHQKAAAAIGNGRFRDEILPIEIEEVTAGPNGTQNRQTLLFDTDEHVRPDTNMEALAKLRPVFKQGGSVTAGNSSPLSDGAAAVIVMERQKAEELGLKPLLKFIGYNVGGVRPEIMGMGPIAAVPRVLKRTGMSLDDMGLIELNEAFAAQSVAVIRELGLNEDVLNVNGGAIALGHPLGATGAKLTVQIMHEMLRRGTKYGMVTMCIGGGMGAAGIFENLSQD
ncbi:MAG: acetyl-CoA C-acyltransferase [Ardenticatenaceae bacterium]|nr:acetyl-CoA C-acyltransferase [Ardenticatenaceae bacterium]MCB9446402.1 acetyl-CoA C-acyltransferase [Ardenticatenaceae bacterium]